MNDEDLAQYVPVDIAAIQPESAASFSIFIRARKGYALFRDSGAGFDHEALAQLSGAGVDTVYIKSGDQELLDQYLMESLQAALDDSAAPTHKKVKTIGMASAAMAREILRRPTAPQIDRARPLIESTVNEILAVPEVVYELLLNTDTNFSLHSHMVNSSIFTLALSGFLHDIGKSQLPEQLLDNTGELSTSEWALMRQHSLLGYNILSGMAGMPAVVAEAARGHHERMDGQGYPDGLIGDEIPFAARLAAVMDVFNALTTDTPFRKRKTSFEALTAMRDDMKGQFDVEMLKALIHSLGQQARAAAN